MHPVLPCFLVCKTLTNYRFLLVCFNVSDVLYINITVPRHTFVQVLECFLILFFCSASIFMYFSAIFYLLRLLATSFLCRIFQIYNEIILKSRSPSSMSRMFHMFFVFRPFSIFPYFFILFFLNTLLTNFYLYFFLPLFSMKWATRLRLSLHFETFVASISLLYVLSVV